VIGQVRFDTAKSPTAPLTGVKFEILATNENDGFDEDTAVPAGFTTTVAAEPNRLHNDESIAAAAKSWWKDTVKVPDFRPFTEVLKPPVAPKGVVSTWSAESEISTWLMFAE
jgi:hypothetical protein